MQRMIVMSQFVYYYSFPDTDFDVFHNENSYNILWANFLVLAGLQRSSCAINSTAKTESYLLKQRLISS